MPSPFPFSTVVRECSWKKTQIENKKNLKIRSQRTNGRKTNGHLDTVFKIFYFALKTGCRFKILYFTLKKTGGRLGTDLKILYFALRKRMVLWLEFSRFYISL